jgi:hypothetical protein
MKTGAESGMRRRSRAAAARGRWVANAGYFFFSKSSEAEFMQ